MTIAQLLAARSRVTAGRATALIRAIRWPETVHFLIMVFAGLLLADRVSSQGWAGFVFSLGAGAAVTCLYMYASLLNDVSDIPVDIVSNPSRPIVAGLMKPSEAISAAWFFAGAAVLLSFLLGYATRWLVLISLLLAWAYSSPPVRMRRYVFSSLVIGVGSMLAFLIGYLAMDFGHAVILPLSIKLVSLVILVAFSVGQMIRDLKDIDGDAAAGITTLFTILGRDGGKRMMAVLLGVCFVVPLTILHSWADVIAYVLAGAASIYLFYVREAADCVILLSSVVSLYTVVRLVGR